MNFDTLRRQMQTLLEHERSRPAGEVSVYVNGVEKPVREGER